MAPVKMFWRDIFSTKVCFPSGYQRAVSSTAHLHCFQMRFKFREAEIKTKKATVKE